MFAINRSSRNPLVSPQKGLAWQSIATTNGCPIVSGKKVDLLYRAITAPDRMKNIEAPLSTIGFATSTNGLDFSGHRQIITPEYAWEQYGCEDPRVTNIDGEYFIFYTALGVFPFRKEGIKVAVALSHDLKKISEKHLVTPFNAKAMALFPEKINGKFAAILTVNTDQPPPPTEVAIRYFDKKEDIWNQRKWETWYKNLSKHTISLKRSASDHAEVGAPPIKTDKGWLLIYSHTENYFSEHKTFGIEAVLLDSTDPQKVIGRTRFPFLIPELVYEKYGYVPNAIFPSGAYVEKGTVHIYYGASDTTVARASMNLSDLLTALEHTSSEEIVTRYEQNPVLKPIPEHAWEAKNVFNPTAIDLEGSVHILYRAMSEDNTSSFGYARSRNGKKIDERLPEPVYVPRADFEMKKSHPTGNSGCEDPRITCIGNTLYMCYTAYNGVHPPQIAITAISKKDFLSRAWNWQDPIALTNIDVDDKDACLFPEKIKGKYMLIHRIASYICADFSESLEFTPGQINSCIDILEPRHGMWDSKKVGLAGTPHKTKYGWLMLYHGIGEDLVYRLGAALLDLNDPTKVLSRTAAPIFEPEAPYETEGEVANVVFPCGSVIRQNNLFIYYGGADRVCAVAVADLKKLLHILQPM